MANSMNPILKTRYFGEIPFAEEDVLSFPRGLPAFEEERRWLLLDDGESPIRWLQSINDGGPALPVTAPDVVMPDYNARIPEDDMELVGAQEASDLVLLTVLSVPEVEPWRMTADLRAPILVNIRTRRAVQVIALDEEYSIRHPALPDELREAMRIRHVRRTRDARADRPRGRGQDGERGC